MRRDIFLQESNARRIDRTSFSSTRWKMNTRWKKKKKKKVSNEVMRFVKHAISVYACPRRNTKRRARTSSFVNDIVHWETFVLCTILSYFFHWTFWRGVTTKKIPLQFRRTHRDELFSIDKRTSLKWKIK